MDQDVNVPRWICSESEKGSELRHFTSEQDEESYYHIWIERLLPTMVQGYVPEHV